MSSEDETEEALKSRSLLGKEHRQSQTLGCKFRLQMN